MVVEYSCCSTEFFTRIGICISLVLFAGLMSGLTLGLMSLNVLQLQVIAISGTPNTRKHAAKILPVVQNQHLLLCTLVIANAAAMEALPIFLDSLVTAWVAVLLSVTLILMFGEIIPQAVCSRYGLAIGAAATPLVRVLVWVCFPVAYPISKLLDCLLGKEHKELFHRAEIKALVNLHGNEAGKGGELTHDETTVIAGALELSEKTAVDAMTPISDIFAIDVNSKLDRDLMKLIMEEGHRRVPVYYENPGNIIGLILVKNLLTISPADEVPVKNITTRKIPRVSETMPLYDILHEFQKGHSHMAVVVRKESGSELSTVEYHLHEENTKEVTVEVDREKQPQKTLREISKRRRHIDSEILHMNENQISEVTEDGVAIGIITMEDVIEELLQEGIYDETD